VNVDLLTGDVYLRLNKDAPTAWQRAIHFYEASRAYNRSTVHDVREKLSSWIQGHNVRRGQGSGARVRENGTILLFSCPGLTRPLM